MADELKAEYWEVSAKKGTRSWWRTSFPHVRDGDLCPP
jgi:hypothetical protein